MAKEIIVKSWNLKDIRYGPVLIEVLTDVAENPDFRHKAAIRLGEVNAIGALDVLSKYLFDKDQLVRKACAESLGGLGDKRAIRVLKEFIQQEKWEPARKTAEISIKRLEGDK